MMKTIIWKIRFKLWKLKNKKHLKKKDFIY